MKILQLCKKFPYPLKDGESIAVTYMSKALRELGSQLTLLAMNTTKHFFDVQQLPSSFDHYRSIHTVNIDNRVKPKDAFLNLFSEDSYHIARFVSEEFKQKLIQLLRKQKFDVIQLETLYLAPYIPTIRKYSNAIIAMRAHNVEHEIWERVTANTKLLPKKWYLNHLTEKLKHFEVQHLNRYDVMVAITQRDLNFFSKLGFRKKGIVSPIGLEMDRYKPDYQSFQQPLSLSFIGSLDWVPNVEGLEWFIQKVMPIINKQHPKIELHVAGRNMPKRLYNYSSKTIKVHGEVPSSTEFLNKYSVMIVPLFSGSGMRAKILEAMALGKVVISTPLGMEGIHATEGDEVLMAQTASTFAQQVKYCYEQHQHLEKIGRQARSFIEETYDYKAVAKRLLEFYGDLVYQRKAI